MTPVQPGELAAIVTFLEMRARPRPAPLPASPLRLVRWDRRAPDRYRALFRRVGQRWLWFSRLVLDDAALTAIIHDSDIIIFAVVDRQGIEIGLLELDFRTPGGCELAFVGLVPELTGRGHGRWLLARALALGWRDGVERLSVHTCTLDHPAALGVYGRHGFVAWKRAVEIFADPRLLGVLPRDAAPQIALLDPANAR